MKVLHPFICVVFSSVTEHHVREEMIEIGYAKWMQYILIKCRCLQDSLGTIVTTSVLPLLYKLRRKVWNSL
ncbi:hypothetical protein Y1Q_0009093 [Alligator mississippiensis]|uniref:Uncharacterized protein n=1 Tax=Alligator mississippiensis TaxID=8496 RepID=A0A151M2C3_ALLMI|nr:hypothetical protein Y1Q_0009093 [Alligator mississippiensis]